MSKFVPIPGPVVSDTVYCDGERVAKDVAITFPEVAPTMADLSAMGTMSVPVWQRFENMEAAITKIGIDLGLRALVKPDMKPLEARWVQTVTDANGISKNVGCKAFLKGIPTKIPGLSITPGEQSESEITLTVTRYALFVDGVEMFLIDRLAGIVRVGGTDYAGDIDSML